MDDQQKQLLKKFLEGRCSAIELSEVQALLNQPDSDIILDEIMYESAVGEWEEKISTDPYMAQRIAQKKIEMQVRILNAEPEQFPRSVKRASFLFNRSFFHQAALWLGIFLLTGFALLQIKINFQSPPDIIAIEIHHAQGSPEKFLLPDSSAVYLAAGSTLKYQPDFSSGNRTVQLSGEAFFDVKPDAAHPFIIHTELSQTKVLGTSFKVSAFAHEPLEVAVATGKVGVSLIKNPDKNEFTILQAGRKISWNRFTDVTKLSDCNTDDLIQWKDGSMIFKDNTLERVTAEISRRYRTSFTFADDETRNYEVSGTFSADEPLNNVLEMLAFVGKFKYTSTQKDSTLKFTIYKMQ